MRRWFFLLAGLLIWAAHFTGVYLIASWADVWSSVEAPGPRLFALAFSVACLLAVGGVAAYLWRRPVQSGAQAWERRVGLTGALVAAISVVWQTAPLAF